MMPPWISTPLMLAGLLGLFDLGYGLAVGQLWNLPPLLVVIAAGIAEKRRIRKITLLEDYDTRMVWRQDYRKPLKDKPAAPESN